MFQLESIIRKNIQALIPYASARSEYTGDAICYLDANENNHAGAYSRYPDPLQEKLKEQIKILKNVPMNQIFIGNGSDEPIDLLIRATCNPGTDNIVTITPSYGMYEVSAHINDITIRKVLLNEDFQPDTDALMAAIDSHTKLIFLCSPNNPTGNLINPAIIENVLTRFEGILVIDEAYIDFASGRSWIGRLNDFPNLVILQTLSKAWGLAALRLGIAFSSPEIIEILNKIKPPYNVSLPAQEAALEVLKKEGQIKTWIDQITAERNRLAKALLQLDFIDRVFPSDANFLLVKVPDADHIYQYLCREGIIVRNRNGMPLCDNCIRITIGTEKENNLLIKVLKNYNK